MCDNPELKSDMRVPLSEEGEGGEARQERIGRRVEEEWVFKIKIFIFF